MILKLPFDRSIIGVVDFGLFTQSTIQQRFDIPFQRIWEPCLMDSITCSPGWFGGYVKSWEAGPVEGSLCSDLGRVSMSHSPSLDKFLSTTAKAGSSETTITTSLSRSESSRVENSDVLHTNQFHLVQSPQNQMRSATGSRRPARWEPHADC